MAQKKGANKYDHEVVGVQELRSGPWTLEEDSLLIHYIARHGEGRWNLLARCSGLKRTGKSCRLRWLNYLKPDVKRGNLSLEEQFLILELHSKWGNRWSRIAQYLPGRTDNEIKNYWRTRVQKQARQLKIDANSAAFRDTVRYYWMPRLIERMASNGSSSIQSTINQNYTIQASSSSTLGQQLPQHFNNFPSQDYGKIHSRRICTIQASLEPLDGSSLHKGKTHLSVMQGLIRCKPLHNSFFQDYHLDPSSTNGYGTNASSDMFVHGMHNGHNSFEELDLASSSDCIEEGSNLGDELWGLDELVACR